VDRGGDSEPADARDDAREVWPKLAANFEGFAGRFARRLRRHRPEVMFADLERRGVLSI